MPPMNLSWRIYGRPVKPVAFTLMLSMIVLGVISIVDLGILSDSLWADIIGMIAFVVAGLFIFGWIRKSQTLTEYALMGAFFVWGFRVWAIVLVNGGRTLTLEAFYLAGLWALVSAGSWLLERSDPASSYAVRGEKWTRH